MPDQKEYCVTQKRHYLCRFRHQKYLLESVLKAKVKRPDVKRKSTPVT